MMNFNVVLFPEFETLDVFGPVEVIGKLENDFKIEFYSQHGGVVKMPGGSETANFTLPQVYQPG